MEETYFNKWAKEIAQKTGFVLGEKIYRAGYYSSEKIRSLIFDGSYQNKPAVLKLYDEPRMTYQNLALKQFNAENKSKVLLAPQVYTDEAVSPKKGWLIMEKLPAEGQFLSQPLPQERRSEFLGLYLEYKKNAPQKPNRPLMLSENLPADEFHIFRIGRWLELANHQEAELVMMGQSPILKADEFIPRYKRGLAFIRQEFSKRKIVWSVKGLFTPNDIYELPDKQIYYLTDFCRAKMYPQGYELSSIIWADWLISADWQMEYSVWKKGIDQWLAEFKKIAPQLGLENFSDLMKASLIERSLGTILADICATERPREDKEARISLLYKLLDDLLS